jgi:hypothetical protein
MEQAKVVESYEEAEKESLKGDDEGESVVGGKTVEETSDGAGKQAEGTAGKKAKKAKKGWFW